MPTPPKKYHDPTIKSVHAYTLAHSARCKLHMSANDRDRNLRFMLGHAFLLDKALYRVAEIEEDPGSDSDKNEEHGEGELRPQVAEVLGDESGEGGIEGEGESEGQSGSLAGGRVKFSGGDNSEISGAKNQDQDEGGQKPVPSVAKKPIETKPETEFDGDRTPPDEESDPFDLDLTRFTSASQRPPRMIPDNDDEEDDDEPDEAVSPPALPADFDVETIVTGPESEEMNELYERVRGCPCHGMGEKAEKVKRLWEVGRGGAGDGSGRGKRMAIMQVEA